MELVAGAEKCNPAYRGEKEPQSSQPCVPMESARQQQRAGGKGDRVIHFVLM